jgi:hypothetical protein
MKWPVFILFVLLLPLTGLVRAETVVWSDNFETGAGSRWTTGSVWKIGSPTIGPGSAYSGTNCATTGLNSGAAVNVNSRFICTNYNGLTNVLIPAASQFPRLCFQQWFNFQNSLGYVEIKPAGATNWQTISVTNAGFGNAPNSSVIWSRPSIDLSAFAGSSVQFAFHFISGADYGTDPGWYLDDVQLIAGQPTFNNPESFESGLGDWTVDNGIWLAGRPVTGTNAAYVGTNCAGTILNGNYPYNANSRLISPLFTVPTNGAASLNYAQWYKFVNAEGFVEIRSGSTGAWQTISATNLSFGSSVLSSAGWVNTNVNLSAYSGQTVQVAFHFISGPSGYSTAPGWYIDNVSVNNIALAVPTGTSYVYVGNTLFVTNVATLIPAGPATFTSLSALPEGATLNSSSGLFTWTPTDSEANSSVIITLSVTNANGLGATNSFAVQVLPPPTLTVPTNQQTVYAGQTLTVTNVAANSFSTGATFLYLYALASDVTNVWEGPTNGVFTWTPAAAQAGSNEIFVAAKQITDTNPPVPLVINAFSVLVSLPPSPQLLVNSAAALNAGGFNFGSTGNINGISWEIETSTNLADWSFLTNVTVSNSVLQITDPAATNYSSRFYRAVLP